MRAIRYVFLGFLLVLSLAAVPAWAVFSGENGVIRFSFDPGDDLQPVTHATVGENGVTVVDLYCWLTDVEPLKKEGVAFTGVGAFELLLTIDGAEGFILKQEYFQDFRQVGSRPGHCVVGLDPGMSLEDGRVQLVHWEILFQGQPEDVVFGLDPAGLTSCLKDPECDGSDMRALYVGDGASGLNGYIFGAGYQPAYLNPSQEVDLQDRHGQITWRDRGQFELR